MIIEQGKRYVTKAGEVIGPVIWDDAVKVWRRNANFTGNDGDYWHPNGSRYGHVDDDQDLISEAKLEEGNTE